MLTDFQNSFTDSLNSKFLVISTIPPHLKRVATLPCEILMSERQQQPETCTLVYVTK